MKGVPNYSNFLSLILAAIVAKLFGKELYFAINTYPLLVNS